MQIIHGLKGDLQVSLYHALNFHLFFFPNELPSFASERRSWKHVQKKSKL